MKNSSEKAKISKSDLPNEVEESEQEEFDVDERVKFRVCKKLSKVLFLNGGKKSSIKKQCESFAKVLEEQVRERSEEFP